MAKQRGPVASTYTGRVGNVVGAKLKGGEYIARSYQPQVKNPNTLRQRVSRGKLALASAAAAVFAEAINIGFAKAAAGTKMYPRNMFVKGVVPVSSGVFTVSGESVTMDYSKLEFSKAQGITVMPICQAVLDGDTGAIEVTCENASAVDLPAGSKLGLVVVATTNDNDVCVVVCGEAATGVTIPVEVVQASGLNHVAMFFKEIPEAYNGVSAMSIPWKYPSLTGPSTTLNTLG